MSTHAYLYMPNEVDADGKIVSFRSVFVYQDGYLPYTGPLLAKHFTDPEKVKALFDLGDISRLCPEITKPIGHSFDNPVDGYSIFYGRDRGERNVGPAVVYDFAMPGRFNNGKVLRVPKIDATDYIFDGVNWFCYDAGFDMAPDNIGELNAVLIATGNI